jgi:hypothetical protein
MKPIPLPDLFPLKLSIVSAIAIVFSIAMLPVKNSVARDQIMYDALGMAFAVTFVTGLAGCPVAFAICIGTAWKQSTPKQLRIWNPIAGSVCLACWILCVRSFFFK